MLKWPNSCCILVDLELPRSDPHTVTSVRVPVTTGTDWDRQTRQGTWPTGVLLGMHLHCSTGCCRHTWTGYKWANSSTAVAAQRKLVIHKSCPERRVSSPWTLSDYSCGIAFIKLCIFKLSQHTVLQCCHYYSCTMALAGMLSSEPLWYSKITTWNFAK